jgi:hypothetical protein
MWTEDIGSISLQVSRSVMSRCHMKMTFCEIFDTDPFLSSQIPTYTHSHAQIFLTLTSINTVSRYCTIAPWGSAR